MTCKECGKELPITSFKTTRWGTKAQVCNQCAAKKRMDTVKVLKEKRAFENENKVNDARQLRLKDFTPRELMEELAARGYKGTLTYTITQTIDITDF